MRCSAPRRWATSAQHFPDTDPRYAGADSIELLRATVTLVAGAGFAVVTSTRRSCSNGRSWRRLATPIARALAAGARARPAPRERQGDPRRGDGLRRARGGRRRAGDRDGRRQEAEQAVNRVRGSPWQARVRCENRLMEDHVRGSVLVVDDEPTIAEVVSRYLERAGYRTRVAADGAQALEQVAHQRPDLVVLDLMLPGIDGLEVMRRLRDRGPRPDRHDPADRQGRGIRPGGRAAAGRRRLRGQAVLARRARRSRRRGAAAGRQLAGPRRSRSSCSDMTIDPAARRVFVRGEEVSADPARVRRAAVPGAPPRPGVLRNQLMDAIWQYSFYTDTSTVTVHIRRLRAKIEARPGAAAPHRDGLGRRLPVRAMNGGWPRACAWARVRSRGSSRSSSRSRRAGPGGTGGRLSC